MPFNGSGTFTRQMRWQDDAAANVKIRADRHDTEDDGLAAGLSNCITKDGQTQPSANIPMNGKKLTNLGAPTTDNDAATKKYVDTIKSFTTGLEISGADANGVLKFTSTTGSNGFVFAGADFALLAKIAGDPASFPNRLVLNDKADGTGSEMVALADNGIVYAGGLYSNKSTADGIGVTIGAIGAGDTVNSGGHIGVRGKANGNTIDMYTGGTDTAAFGLCAQFRADKSLAVNGYVYAVHNFQSSTANVVLAGSGGGVYLRPYGAGNGGAQAYLTTDGNFTMVHATVSGNVWAGYLHSYGNINAANAFTIGGGTCVFGLGGSGRYLQFASGWYWDWNASNGTLTWNRDVSGWGAIFEPNGNLQIRGINGAKQNAGSWISWSDARLKNIGGTYDSGLAKILKVIPRHFTFKEIPDKEFVGVIAQEIENVFPETVTRENGTIDGKEVSDKRMFDPTNLTYALINAVKELSAKLDEAHARIAALEAR